MMASMEACVTRDDALYSVENDAVGLERNRHIEVVATIDVSSLSIDTKKAKTESLSSTILNGESSCSIDRPSRHPLQQNRTSNHQDGDGNGDAQQRFAQIDSALRSALSDPRERMALLRCEHYFVLFLQATHLTDITVGGAYNSLVVGLPSANSNGNPAVLSMDGGASTGNTIGSNKPTSFQRCWLHRLADRFGIVRESLNAEWIRCKKTPDSAIPDLLLSDLSLTPEYVNVSNIDNDTLVSQRLHGAVGATGAKGISTTNNKTGNSRRSSKMKIMKRDSSSSLSACASSRSQKEFLSETEKSLPKRGSLPEKEKAYAEARARIFNEGTTSTNVDSLETTCTVAATLSKSASLVSIPSTMLTSDQENKGQIESNLQLSRPVAVAIGTGISKATWRNRQQEENDPDFQRGVLYSKNVPLADWGCSYGVTTKGIQNQNERSSYYYQNVPYQHQQQQFHHYHQQDQLNQQQFVQMDPHKYYSYTSHQQQLQQQQFVQMDPHKYYTFTSQPEQQEQPLEQHQQHPQAPVSTRESKTVSTGQPSPND